MAAVTDRIVNAAGGLVYVELTFDVPAGLSWAPDDNLLSEADESLCDLISVRAVNNDTRPWLFRMRRRNGQTSINYTLAAGADVTGTAPFPGGLRTLDQIGDFTYGPV